MQFCEANDMKKQKVLLVHNYYQLPGGEDTVVANEKKLLEENGHEVTLYTRHNTELKELKSWEKLLLPFSTIFNIRTYRDVRRIIRQQGIDIIHVHNTLTLISPSVYYAAVSCGIPVIQTVHNFRLLCPGATFYRDGAVCEDCVTKSLGCAVKHKCYRGSRAQTLACVVSTIIHRWTGIYRKLHYICLTEFNRDKLQQLPGIRPEQIFVKPNFVYTEPTATPTEARRNQYVFAGRLEKLKGVDLLLKAWMLLGNRAPELLLCGTGPLETWCDDFIREHHLTTVKRMGQVPNHVLRMLLAESKAIILPTQCYEGFPMNIAEAFSAGTPVICSNLGNAGAMVAEEVTGLHFQHNSAEALAQAIERFEKTDIHRLGQNARQVYDQTLSPGENYSVLHSIYQKAGKG